MNAIIVTDSPELSKAIANYLKCVLNFECFYFTFDTLSGPFKDIDLVILEVFRYYKDRKELRADGIISAENFAKKIKNILIFSGDILGEKIESPIYWDMGSKESFKEKILKLLKIDLIDYEKEIEKLKDIFKEFITKPKHH